MKSKDDLTRQIQRIYKKHGEHRLYKTALRLTMLYNENMSQTDLNKKLHRQYMDCHYYVSGNVKEGMENEAQRLLDEMGAVKYPVEIYSVKTNF